MTTYYPADSKSELISHARQEARLSRGRGAFVRRARLLPVGLPVSIGVAALLYGRERRRGRSDEVSLRVAAGALLGALALTAGIAALEWELRRANYRASRW